MSNNYPNSLLSCFCPPTDYVGEFALLTGYSADALFLNDALEKFTHNVGWRRAQEGKASIALMLDKNHRQISTVDCPGLIHLPFDTNVKNEFKLLHSKVGLLLFKNTGNNEQVIRLVVSTGNWTNQTIESSLDLVWSIDYVVKPYEEPQARTDIVAAFEFMSATLKHFDSRILVSNKRSQGMTLTADQYLRFLTVFKGIEREKDYISRFFDNRTESLVKQLPRLVKAHTRDTKRNYLLLGSGFYEGDNGSNKLPITISTIENTLIKTGLLNKHCREKDIYINPKNCQVISSCADTLRDNGWEIRNAFDPIFQDKQSVRSLHAKFIFSAKNTSNGKCVNPWLYLGSGNLTKPGFLNRASKNVGNLEAGVVFCPEGIHWEDKDDELSISNRLPVDWKSKRLIENNDELTAGGDMPEHDDEFYAAPVSFFTLSKVDIDYFLLTPTPCTDLSYEVLNPSNTMCEVKENKIKWPFESPRQVKVSWKINGESYSSYVPVFDDLGRLSATKLPELDIDDAWWQLSAFPMLPEDDSIDGEGDETENNNNGISSISSEEKTYHINRMMGLVEHIAQIQTTISERDWTQWCNRLEQTLCQLAKSNTIAYFNKIGVNPISPLWAKPFRPNFAESPSLVAGKLYECVLEKIESKLKLTNLLKLGE